jgi:tetratricopeptide (TPR) repeat protein
MRKATALFVSLVLCGMAFAQNADEENIKKAIEADENSFKNRSESSFRSSWVNDTAASITFLSRTNYLRQRPDSLTARRARTAMANQSAAEPEIDGRNYRIRTNGSMAWVEYDELVTFPNTDTSIFPYNPATASYHVARFMEKEADQWKTFSLIRSMPDSYVPDDHSIESDINNIGYELLNKKMYNEAIEELKLNVKLFPKSFNVYDSLGEAYATVGNKKLAIENYEKSIQLNPKNTNGKDWIAKLKAK